MNGSDTEIQVALTAQTEQLKAGMADGAASVQASTDAMQASITQEAAAFNAAVQAKIDAQVRLNAAFAGGITTTADIAEAEGALDQAMAAGAVSASDYAGYVEALNTAEAEMGAATTASTVAIDENTAAMVVNGGVARELGVLIGELARGNYTRLEGSTVTLANRTGVLSKVFSPLGVSIMAAAGAVLYLGDQMLRAVEETDAFNRAVLSSGDIVGMTSGQLNGLAMQVGAFTGQTDQADLIVQKLAQSGKLSGQALQYGAEAAANAMRLTGESAQQAAHEVESLGGDPAKAVVALNDKYHFLTVELYEQISTLQREGDTFGATEVAAKAFADNTAERVQKLGESMGFFERQLNDFKNGLNVIDQSLRKSFDPTLEEQSAAATHKWFEAQQQLNEAIKAYGNVGGDDSRQAIEKARAYEEATKKEALALRDKVRAEQENAQQQGKAGQQNARLIQEVSEQEKLNQHLKETSLLQEKIAEEKRRVEDIHKADAGSSSIKGINFDASGAVSGGQQWDAIVKKLTQEYSNAGVAARHAASEAKKASSEQMNDLQMQRDGIAINTEERIQADAAVLASATKLYGANSSQQKAALVQMLADEKSFDAQVAAERKAAIEQQTGDAIQGAQAQLASEREALQTKFQLGQTNKQEELSSLAQYEEQAYAIELAALQKELSLLGDKPKMHAQINREIERLQTQHALEMQKISDDAAKANQKLWQDRLRPITRAFDQSIAGMIQGTQTFKQGIDRMLQSILASYVQTGIQLVMHWVANEAAQTTATASGTTTRLAMHAAAATESKTIDAATGKSQIQTAAATGAAKAYQAMVGIPFVGPIVAPIAAAAAFVGIEAFSGSIASAQGGWERVPVDGAPAILHKDEQVLPASYAEGLRKLVSNGGSGQQVHHHYHNTIHAVDARSLTEMLRRNPNALAAGAKHAARNGFALA